MVDIEELKKLPAEEKWRIIDELEASMEGEGEHNPALLQEMEQRYHDVRNGKMKTIPWEDAENIILVNQQNRVVSHV